MTSIKRKAVLYAKNLVGKKYKRRYVIFSVDDYGNVFLESKSARENLRKSGLDIKQSRFCLYDSLETESDLTALFDVLTSVKDTNGSHAVFTPFVLSANIDFDAVESNGYEHYEFELLPTTFSKRPGYESVWKLWNEGIKLGIFVPQFHGREHLNVKLFNAQLKQKNKYILASLKNRSYAAIPSLPNSKVGFTEAFSFDHLDEVEAHKKVIEEGLLLFEKNLGYKAEHFNAPGAREHMSVHETTVGLGIKLIDRDILSNDHQGNGRYKMSFNPMAKLNQFGQNIVFRNCVFEPSLGKDIDWVDRCMTEIGIAFACHKPAHISSHRVNFGGHIEPSIRDHGIKELNRLLRSIVTKWPDVEFVTSSQLLNS